jgi:hypothetical protein
MADNKNIVFGVFAVSRIILEKLFLPLISSLEGEWNTTTSYWMAVLPPAGFRNLGGDQAGFRGEGEPPPPNWG